MLIKLTGVPHPDLNGGLPQPVYIDASRVLLIIQGHREYPKIGSIEEHTKTYDDLYVGMQRIAALANGYMPDMTDPAAVTWMRTLQMAAGDINTVYRNWATAYNRAELHPRVECTEVQLACGTALEHGVMLTRVWVSESPEQVAEAVRASILSTWPRSLTAGA